MSLATEKNIETELVNFARSLVKDPDSGETTTSQDFSGDDSDKTFGLDKYASCINSVTISSVTKHWGVDYTYDFSDKTITFTSAPAAGTNNITVSYDYVGTGASVNDIAINAWGGMAYPSVGLQRDDYPRFGIKLISNTRDASGVGYDGVRGERVYRVWVYSKSKDQVKLKLREFASEFMAKNDWYLDGASVSKSCIPIAGPIEPEIDGRRSGKYFGGFVDLMFISLYEARS